MVQVRVINSFGNMAWLGLSLGLGLEDFAASTRRANCHSCFSQSNDFDELKPSIKDKGLSKIVLFGCKTIKTKLT